MKMNGARIVIASLENHGITVVTGIPGGSILPLYDALAKSRIRHLLTRHEQGAAFIAQGIARSTGRAAVCFATSGPGATNLVTALADAHMDSVPVIAITGQVPRSLIGTDAFQETDIVSVCTRITKKAIQVRSASELAGAVSDAFHTAQSGRKGPVLIDIPKDVFLEEAEYDENAMVHSAMVFEDQSASIIAAAKEINGAKRPVIYAGGGVIASESSALLAEIAHRNSIPVALTLMGLGGFDPHSPLYLGMLGMHGSKSTNMILDEADLVIALGVRFDDRAIGRKESFCPHARIIHVDIDTHELGKIREADLSIRMDLAAFLSQAIPQVECRSRTDWMNRVDELRESDIIIEHDGTGPMRLIDKIRAAAPDDAIITTDVGQHQMWMAQHFPVLSPKTFLTSGGLGTMGFGLPAAIGAALANPSKKVFCISGDGSILMNIQELATLAELNLDVTVIIMNNGQLGLVRQQQEFFYNANFIASSFSRRPDFAAIASGFGIKGLSIDASSFDSLGDIVAQKGPCLIDARIDSHCNVRPMIPASASNIEPIETHDSIHRKKKILRKKWPLAAKNAGQCVAVKS